MDKMNMLVVDSSITYKKMFMQATANLNSNAVVFVTTVEEAMKRIQAENYAIIVIDAEMSRLDDLLDQIRLDVPKAFVLITAGPSKTNEAKRAEVLAKGATDFFIKPIHSSYNDNIEIIKDKLAEIIKVLQGNEKETPVSARKRPLLPVAAPKKTDKNGFRPGIVLFASSTGGPVALEAVLPKLSKDFPVPILVVQHTLPNFTETLAQTLGKKSELKVKVAEHRERVVAGTIYIAPAGVHMKLSANNKICVEDGPLVNGVRPAADILFESVAENYVGSGVLAVVLTGMGKDGEQGLSKLKEKQSCFCIAQSEETCVIYGMPRAVVESGLADKVLDLDKIAFELENFNFHAE